MAFRCDKHQRRKGDDFEVSSCLVPISTFSCWSRTKKSEKVKKLGKWKSSGGLNDSGKKMDSAALTPNYAKSCSSCVPHNGSSGHLKNCKLFNLGGNVVQSREIKDEHNKIMNLHNELESGFQSLKDKLLAKGHADIKGVGSFQEVQSSLCLEDPKFGSLMSRQQSTRKMNLLEAELEAELEHLQLHIDSETMCSEEKDETMVEDSAPEGRFSTTDHGEFVYPFPQVIHNQQHYGVSPYELESRLHEVLEARQQERIDELEEALHCATQKIQDKERELSMWKDTAKLLFQYVPAVLNDRRASARHQVKIVTEGLDAMSRK